MKVQNSVFKKLWLVDDDPDDQLIFQSAVKEVLPSVTLTIFSNSQQLLDTLNQNVPDLLFLDIHLPGSDGKQCLRDIKSNPALQRLPIIIWTGSDNPVEIQTSFAYGATLYLIKPCSFIKLVALLHRLFHLDWNNPQLIACQQLVNDRFIPFGTNG